MKKILLLSCFLLSLKVLPAQTSRFSLSANIGANQPVGAFSQKNITQADAGFAKTGLAGNVTATYMLGKIFGLTALLGAQDNSVNTKEIADQLKAQTGNPVFASSRVTSKHWQAAKLLAGCTVALPLQAAGKWLFTMRLLGGVLKTSLPQQAGVIFIPGNNGSTDVVSYVTRSKLSVPITFAATTGAGLQYNISKMIFLSGNVDYNYAAPQCKYPNFLQYGGGEFSSTTATTEPASSQYLYHHRQGMCNISLMIGAGIKL